MTHSNCSASDLAPKIIYKQFLSDVIATLNLTFGQQPNLVTGTSTTSASPEIEDDQEGALKFTVAVVIVYGVGVILMLAFHTRASRRQSVQEERVVQHFVKKISHSKVSLERKEQKSRIVNLIQQIHTMNLDMASQHGGDTADDQLEVDNKDVEGVLVY